MNPKENSSSTAHKTAANLMWRFFERCGVQGVAFLVSVVLARLLDPDLHGTIALVTVFTSIMQVFVNSGMGSALVQKKDADQLDYSTVFYFNMVMGIGLYAVMFVAAPWIAAFYKMPDLTPLVRVLSLTLVVSGLKNMQHTYVSKHMMFKKFFFSTIGGTLVSAVVGIAMAYMGYGVWALVAQTLTTQFIAAVILWIAVPWRPTLEFSFERLKGLFSYGWKLLASSLIDTVYNDLRTLVIGKKYSSTDLAFYNKGNQFPKLIVTNINTSIDSVLLPVMAKEQDDRARVRAMTRRAIRISSFCMWPLMVGLAVCGEPLIRLVLTEKWMPCLPFMYVFCLTYGFQPIHTANLNAIKAMGRSDLFLKLEIIKKVIGIAAILISMRYGVMWIAYSLIVTSLLSQFINAFPNRKLLGYHYGRQLMDILPSLLLALGMGAVVYCVKFLGLSDILTLCLQVPLGGILYIGGAWLLKMESFLYIQKQVAAVVKRFIRKRKK